jgi:hypothetical protein
MVETMAQQWARILAHLKSLRDAKEPKHGRRHREHGPSQVVQAYATEMRRHRNQHRG